MYLILKKLNLYKSNENTFMLLIYRRTKLRIQVYIFIFEISRKNLFFFQNISKRHTVVDM